MKVYFGVRTHKGARPTVLRKVLSPAEIENRTVNMNEADILPHHVLHSPDGFEWGYGGSGPADLAYNILLDYFDGDSNKAHGIYQIFKQEFICPISENSWLILGSEIEDWLRKKFTHKPETIH